MTLLNNLGGPDTLNTTPDFLEVKLRALSNKSLWEDYIKFFEPLNNYRPNNSMVKGHMYDLCRVYIEEFRRRFWVYAGKKDWQALDEFRVLIKDYVIKCKDGKYDRTDEDSGGERFTLNTSLRLWATCINFMKKSGVPKNIIRERFT